MNETGKKRLHSVQRGCVKMTKLLSIATIVVFVGGLLVALVHDGAERKEKEARIKTQKH